MAKRKLENLANLENLGIIIPSFRFCLIAKIKRADIKILKKRCPRFPRFPSFSPELVLRKPPEKTGHLVSDHILQ